MVPTTDRLAGGALVLFGLLAIWEARRFPLGSLWRPGPAYMPTLLALLLVVFGAAIALSPVRRRLRDVGWEEWRHAVVILGICAFVALALEGLGYRLTMSAALLALLLGLERKGVVISLAVTALIAWGSFFLFDTLLRVPLPRGPLGL